MIHRKLNLSGSYTIEASLIMPVIIFLIIAIIYCGFYLHDSLNMQSSMYSYILNNYKIKNNICSREVKEYIDRNLIVMDSKKVNCNIDDDSMSMYSSSNLDIPFQGLKSFLSKWYGNKNEKMEATNLIKSDFLRKYKIATDIKNNQ